MIKAALIAPWLFRSAVLSAASWTCLSTACASAISFSDVEVDLQIVSVTQNAQVTFSGSGTKFVDPGPIPAAVGPSFFDRLRIAGTQPANGVSVPMPVGSILEFDAQVDLLSNALTFGQSAEARIDMTGLLEIQNNGAVDATINFYFEREHRLRTEVDDPLVDAATAHKTFALSVSSFNAAGASIVSLPDFVVFDQQVQQGGESSLPEDQFNFDVVVPAGGSGILSMQTTAYGEVARVPEPNLIVLGLPLVAVGAWRWSRLRG